MKAVLMMAGLAAAVDRPTFPDDWTAQEIETMITYQGEFVHEGDNWCCQDQSNCEVQTGYSNVKKYFSYSTRQIRLDGDDGTVTIGDFKKFKEVQVDPTTLACISYCPLAEEMRPFAIDDESFFNGTQVIDGVKTNIWRFNETLAPHIKIIMEDDRVYVDQTDPTTSKPMFERDEITPFGIHLAEQNESWTNFVAGKIDPSLLAWTGESTCPKASDCGQQAAMQRLLIMRDTATWLARHKENQAAKRKMLGRKVKHGQGASIPNIPSDYQTQEASNLVVYQGGYVKNADGDFCCPQKSNCKIQTEAAFGTTYMSASTNQSRFGNSEQGVVSDWNIMKEMAVDANNTCQSYCPLQDAPPAAWLPSDATDMGEVVIDNVATEHWHWEDKLGKKIVMDIAELYVVNNSAPYLSSVVLTPFNSPPLATANSTYTNFKGGPQDPALFKVNGIESCPLDQSCQQ